VPMNLEIKLTPYIICLVIVRYIKLPTNFLNMVESKSISFFYLLSFVSTARGVETAYFL
jgi:hypothetical protein